MALRAKRSWDTPWSLRPREEAANLNPAFCAELLSRAVSEYYRVRELPFPFALTFLILPIALHKRTREELPGNSSSAFVGWLAEHRAALTELPERVTRLVPITREALLFSIQHDVLRFDQGALIPGTKPIRSRSHPERTTDDADEARRAAALLGRWFANQGSASSIMLGFGVTP
jgi:hypothetical protein